MGLNLTRETYIGSQPATPGGGFVYYGPTHYIWFWEQVVDLAYVVTFYFVVAMWCCIDSGFQLSSSTQLFGAADGYAACIQQNPPRHYIDSIYNNSINRSLADFWGLEIDGKTRRLDWSFA